MPQDARSLIVQLARARGLDPRAVLAVAAQEGLGGGVGDHGTSFGPWQLHFGGAYPGWAPHDSHAAQAWAWSPQGIGYALSQMAGVARGEHGAQAVQDIVYRFERPADPSTEYQHALGAYGAGVGAAGPVSYPGSNSGAVPASGQATASGGAPDPKQLALALISQIGRSSPDYSPLASLLTGGSGGSHQYSSMFANTGTPSVQPPIQPLPNARLGQRAPVAPLPPARPGQRVPVRGLSLNR